MLPYPVKVIYILLVFIIFLACWNPFAPKLDNSSEGALILTEQKNPQEVLQNFDYAYTSKDSVLYADLLDSSFVFVYEDIQLGRLVSWGRDVDLKSTGRLFRSFDVIDLTWNKEAYSDTSYGPSGEVIIEIPKPFRLALYGSKEGDFAVTGTAVFSFVKNSYDNKWRIVRWKDESEI
jgi:hypothetical protein